MHRPDRPSDPLREQVLERLRIVAITPGRREAGRLVDDDHAPVVVHERRLPRARAIIEGHEARLYRPRRGTARQHGERSGTRRSRPGNASLADMFRFIVLGLLRHGRTLHGYALMKSYRARTGVQMSTGTFYRELQNLVGEGLVRPVERAPGDDARRTPYEITTVGSDLFDGWLVRPPGLALNSDDELTARTMFLHEAPPDTARRMIDAWKEELWLLSKRVERDRQNELHRCATEREPFSMLVLVLARRLRHIAGDVAYLDELRAALDELQPTSPAPWSLRRASSRWSVRHRTTSGHARVSATAARLR